MEKQCDKKTDKKKIIDSVKTEFSKLFCVLVALGIGFYAIWCGVEYYKLTELAIRLSNGEYTVMPPTELAVVCVTGILVSLLSYLGYNGFLKNSLNKNKLSINNVTGVVESIQQNDVEDIVKKTIEAEFEDDTALNVLAGRINKK